MEYAIRKIANGWVVSVTDWHPGEKKMEETFSPDLAGALLAVRDAQLEKEKTGQ